MRSEQFFAADRATAALRLPLLFINLFSLLVGLLSSPPGTLKTAFARPAGVRMGRGSSIHVSARRRANTRLEQTLHAEK